MCKTIKVGFVGVGVISDIYLKNITQVFENLQVAGLCDLIEEKARVAAEKYRVEPVFATMQDLFADSNIDIVLNLTRPHEHYEVTKAAILAGKHVYTEKPLADTFEKGQELVQLAKAKGVLLCGAPDTFLGSGIQTCRQLIEDGMIGDIVGLSGFMVCRGHESWHADPAFYYSAGGGPVMDMGPYYITAFANLAGSVSRVCAMGRKTFAERTITSQPLYGTKIPVHVDTNVAAVLEFESGAIGTLYTTFDVYSAQVPHIEVYGTEGTLCVPDPNTFGGPVLLYRPSCKDLTFQEIPLLYGYEENSRGLGVCDMAHAIMQHKIPRANDSLPLHTLEVLTAIQKSSAQSTFESITTHYLPQERMIRTVQKGQIL